MNVFLYCMGCFVSVYIYVTLMIKPFVKFTWEKIHSYSLDHANMEHTLLIYIFILQHAIGANDNMAHLMEGKFKLCDIVL